MEFVYRVVIYSEEPPIEIFFNGLPTKDEVVKAVRENSSECKRIIIKANNWPVQQSIPGKWWCGTGWEIARCDVHMANNSLSLKRLV